jgi:hypothetical protein
MLNTELYDDFDLLVSPEQALTLCRQAVADLGWRVLDQGPDFIRGKEVAASGLSFTWPAEVQLVVESEEPGVTTVYLDGKIFGLGPIQKGHLQGQMGNLRNRIELLASQPSALSASDGTRKGALSEELEKLAALKQQGVLSDEEFQQAKARLLG